MIEEAKRPDATVSPDAPDPLRRRLLAFLGVTGIGTTVFGRALAAQVEAEAATPRVTESMIEQAEWIAGIDLTDEERALMRDGVDDLLGDYERIRGVALDNAVQPAMHFDPTPGVSRAPVPPTPVALAPRPDPRRPETDDELAFAPVHVLARLLRSGRVSSVELTELYLARIERFDPTLRCVITGTPELALEQAARADRERAAGRDRGPLHGVPWGVKDLFAVPGYRTTWGAAPFRDQVIDDTATVVARLEAAGAVLLGKLAVGALAWGDVWFDATTKNPWNPEQGSSGSSAGSASATAAGLAGFTIGTETLGSIVSPCTRCGATGLRPTYGRVSRAGAMALSWSMDKVGPITRSVEDCALVLGAIHGADGRDASAVDRPFDWPWVGDPKRLRIGYVEAHFDDASAAGIENEAFRARALEGLVFDRRTLDTLRSSGFTLVPITLPDRHPVGALSFILSAEAACAFDALTRSGRDEDMVRQVKSAWPNVFREAQTIPAVEYLRANRIRSLVMEEMHGVFEQVDLYVTPSFAGGNLLRTNLTGHPQVVLPNGFRAEGGTPTSITFTGDLFQEAPLLAVARAYQQATDFHRRRPDLASVDAAK